MTANPERMPSARRAVLALCAAVLLAGAAAHASIESPRTQPRAPEMVMDTTTIEPDENMVWNVPAGVNNHLPYGLYLDSLKLEIERLGPLDPGGDRIQRADLSGIVRAVGAIEAGGVADFVFIHPAVAESAKLTFRLHGHDARQEPRVMEVTLTAVPGPFERESPSRTLAVDGRRVEYLAVAPRGVYEPPAPAVLLIHGHGASARPMLRAARLLSERGWWVALLSQPGYGASEGPADLMGPATLAAAEAALRELSSTEGVDPKRIAVWGFSRGATVAAQLAARHPELSGVIVQSGIYDLWATWRETTLPGFREAIEAEAGRDSAAWRVRSPVLEARRVRTPLLVLHGGRDTQVPPGQARDFAARAQAAGAQVEVHVLPAHGHAVPATAGNPRAIEFLKRRFSR